MDVPVPPESRGLIFDLDGTLADTMPLHLMCWKAVLAKRGVTFCERVLVELAGAPASVIVRRLVSDSGLDLDEAALLHEKQAMFNMHLHMVKPLDPVARVLRAERTSGQRRIAVGTGGAGEVARSILRHLGMLDMCDALVTSDDVVQGKPAPDTFLLCAQRMGVAPEHCVVYEDADLGLQAARAAGMHVIDVRPFVGGET